MSSIKSKRQHPINTIFDQLFNHSIGDIIGSDFVNSQPSVNVIDSEKEFTIELAAPGLEKEDFNINTEKNHLIISVEKEKGEAKENEKFTRREFAYTSFKRSFNLGDKVKIDSISANYENGILNILIPKKEEAIEIKRKIEIS